MFNNRVDRFGHWVDRFDHLIDRFGHRVDRFGHRVGRFGHRIDYLIIELCVSVHISKITGNITEREERDKEN